MLLNHMRVPLANVLVRQWLRFENVVTFAQAVHNDCLWHPQQVFWGNPALTQPLDDQPL